MISDEAVEAAAKAFIEHGTLLPALEAAAPYMLAQGWDEAAASVRNDMEIGQRLYVMRRIKETNPYRAQA